MLASCAQWDATLRPPHWTSLESAANNRSLPAANLHLSKYRPLFLRLRAKGGQNKRPWSRSCQGQDERLRYSSSSKSSNTASMVDSSTSIPWLLRYAWTSKRFPNELTSRSRASTAAQIAASIRSPKLTHVGQAYIVFGSCINNQSFTQRLLSKPALQSQSGVNSGRTDRT